MSTTSRVTPISLSSSRRAARGMAPLSDTDILRDYAHRDKKLAASDRRVASLRKMAVNADFALDEHDDAYASWRERDRQRVEHNPIFVDEELTSQQMYDRLRYKKSLTNANWIPSLKARQRDETSTHPLDQFIVARGLNVIGRGGVALNDAVREYSLFSPLDYYTQARIKVGEEKSGSRWSTWLGNIVANNEKLASIQANPDDSYRFLVVDIDRSDALDCALLNEHMPAPSYFVHSTKNGHGHAVYAIRNPVYHGSNTKSLKPLRYWRHVSEKVRRAIGGDINYTGYFTKNPYCPEFVTYWGKSSNMYSLHELDECATRALDARIEHETMKLDDSHEDTTAKKIVRNSRALEEQSVGRNNSIFDAVRKYAYKHRREASSLAVWSETIMQRCIEVSEELHRQGEFSDRERLDNKELACIAKSIANWTWDRESLNGGQYSAEQRQRSARARAARSFSELVSRIKRVLSHRGRAGFRRLRFDRSARMITLPRGVTVREMKRLWRAEFEQNMRSDWTLMLTEDIDDVDTLADDRERMRRLYGLRTLSQLSLAEQCEILEHAMVSPRSYAQIEHDFVLDSGVVKRLTMKYKRTPWLLADQSEPEDAETREFLITEATARWNNAIRNGGTIDQLFSSTADVFDVETAVDGDDVVLETTPTDRFNAYLFAHGQTEDWKPTKLWRFIVLFSQNLVTVRGVGKDRVLLSTPDLVRSSLAENQRSRSAESDAFDRFEHAVDSLPGQDEKRSVIRQLAGQVVRDEFGECAESVPQTLVKLCERVNVDL